MPNDSSTAMQFFHLMLKLAREVRDTIKFAIDTVGGIVKATRNEGKEILDNRKEAKLQKEANKGGEVAINKLQKNHKEVVSEVIQPENLNSFKKFAKEFNLQYSTSKEDDGKIKVHYGTDHQDRFNTTVDSLARSINFKQQNAVNEVKADLNTVMAERTISKDDTATVKTVDNIQATKDIRDLLQELKTEIAELRKENQGLKQEIADLKRNDPLKEVKELLPNVRDNEDKAILKQMGRESLDNLINNAINETKDQPVKQTKQPALER